MTCIRDFRNEINRRALVNMEKTGELEGSHFAAMEELWKELTDDQ